MKIFSSENYFSKIIVKIVLKLLLENNYENFFYRNITDRTKYYKKAELCEILFSPSSTSVAIDWS